MVVKESCISRRIFPRSSIIPSLRVYSQMTADMKGNRSPFNHVESLQIKLRSSGFEEKSKSPQGMEKVSVRDTCERSEIPR